MECPYCHGDMKRGWLSSSHRVLWTQNAEKKTDWKGKNDISLSGWSFWRGTSMTAYLCENCKKIIVDYS